MNIEDEGDTQDIQFWLEYDCETQTTYVRTSVSDVRSEITCPDFKVGPEEGPQQDISWSISAIDGAQPYLLTVRCLACTECSLNPFVNSVCCPYFQIPAILTIEVTSTNGDCANLLGQTGTLIWNGDEFAPVWTGFLFGNEFILTCGGECGTTWCLSGCAGPEQQGDGICDPLELVFTSFGGCANCVNPATGSYTVTITA